MLLELSKCGIHLLPRNEDVEQAGISLKDFQAEERAIADISSSVRAFAYRSCRWNSTIDADNVVVKIRENLEFDREFFEDHEPDWRYVNWWPNKVAYVRCCDLDETADMRIAAGQETHSLLFQALQAAGTTLASEEAAERSQQYSYIDFIDTVKKTLRLTRVLAFT